MRNERQLQVHTKKSAKKNGIGFYKLECVGQTGFPDVLLTYKGWSVFIELKSPSGTGRLSPRQKIVINDLIDQEQETYVIDNPETIDTLIQDLIEREPRPVHQSAI